MSPNARSKALLEREGFLAEITQNRVTKFLTRDLFGVIDCIGVKEGVTLAVQATTASNVASRRKKLSASPALPAMLAAGWRVELWGWKKARGRWQCRREAARPAAEGITEDTGRVAPGAPFDVVDFPAGPTIELAGDGLGGTAAALHESASIDTHESLARTT